MRTPAARSMLVSAWPAQPSSSGISVSMRRPEGSRKSPLSACSGSRRRSTWSVDQRTDATVGMPMRWKNSARFGSYTRATTFLTLNISRATRAAIMFELSPEETAAKAYASVIPARLRVSSSKPTPVTRRPSKPLRSGWKARSSWSMTATVCPEASRVRANMTPTRPAPIMTK